MLNVAKLKKTTNTVILVLPQCLRFYSLVIFWSCVVCMSCHMHTDFTHILLMIFTGNSLNVFLCYLMTSFQVQGFGTIPEFIGTDWVKS